MDLLLVKDKNLDYRDSVYTVPSNRRRPSVAHVSGGVQLLLLSISVRTFFFNFETSRGCLLSWRVGLYLQVLILTVTIHGLTCYWAVSMNAEVGTFSAGQILFALSRAKRLHTALHWIPKLF